MLFNKASCRKRKHYGSTMLTDPDYWNALTDPNYWNALTDPDSRNVLTGPIYSGSLSAVEGPDYAQQPCIFQPHHSRIALGNSCGESYLWYRHLLEQTLSPFIVYFL